MKGIIDLGPELFSDADGKVISYRGDNFYRACGEVVAILPDGGQSTCVKRVDHPGKVHEDYDGRTINASPDLGLKDMPIQQAVFTALGAASMCWENLEEAGIFDSIRAKDIGDQLMVRIRQMGPIYE